MCEAVAVEAGVIAIESALASIKSPIKQYKLIFKHIIKSAFAKINNVCVL